MRAALVAWRFAACALAMRPRRRCARRGATAAARHPGSRRHRRRAGCWSNPVSRRAANIWFPVSGLTGDRLAMPVGVSVGLGAVTELQVDSGYQWLAIDRRDFAPLDFRVGPGDRTSDVIDVTLAMKVRVLAEGARRPAHWPAVCDRAAERQQRERPGPGHAEFRRDRSCSASRSGPCVSSAMPASPLLSDVPAGQPAARRLRRRCVDGVCRPAVGRRGRRAGRPAGALRGSTADWRRATRPGAWRGAADARRLAGRCRRRRRDDPPGSRHRRQSLA